MSSHKDACFRAWTPASPVWLSPVVRLWPQTLQLQALAHVACRLSCVASLGSAATETYTCLQLLGELLLERQNVKVMMSYVSDAGNLKLMMTLLKDSSRSIQFEAFHVFKVRDFPGFLP